MECIKLEKSDRDSVVKNLLTVAHSISSGKRRSYISGWAFIFSADSPTSKTVTEGIAYFNILRGEMSNQNIERDTVGCLDRIIKILNKYI